MVQTMSQPALNPTAAFIEKTPADFEIRNGSLLVRLARNSAEVDAALALRYKVFYEEMRAEATDEMATRKQDFDRYDAFARFFPAEIALAS